MSPGKSNQQIRLIISYLFIFGVLINLWIKQKSVHVSPSIVRHSVKSDTRTNQWPIGISPILKEYNHFSADTVAQNHQPIRFLHSINEQPVWAIHFGAEFWKDTYNPMNRNLQATALDRATIHNAIERVTHSFKTGADFFPSAKAETYHALISRLGLTIKTFSPRVVENASTESEFHLATRQIAGDQYKYFDSTDTPADSKVVLGNTVQTLLDHSYGIVEHIETRKDGIELTWLFHNPLLTDSSITIRTEIAGASDARLEKGAIHLMDESGVARLKIGAAQAVDTEGNRWNLMCAWNAGLLEISVPGEILATAKYPLAIDPLISPEYGVDQPVVSDAQSTQAAPSVAANSQSGLVTWIHGKGDQNSAAIFAARLNTEGKLLDPYGITIAAAANEQMTTVVTASEQEFLVVWSAPKNTATSDWDIFAARVDIQGNVKTVAPLCNATGIQTSPTAASNGTNFFIAWRDSRNTSIYGTLLKTDGSLSATNGLILTTAANDQLFPAVASLGGEFFVVWQDYRKATTSLLYSDIFGSRISANGEVLDPAGIAICTKTNTQWFPAIASNGTNYLVVWEEYHIEGNDIYAARVGSDGIVWDTNSLAICTARNSQGSPAVASQDGQFLVVWEDFRNSNNKKHESDIYAAQVNHQGKVLYPDGIVIASYANNQCLPAIASVFGGYQIAWQDFRNHPLTAICEIYGARCSIQNQTNVVSESLISQTPNIQLTPSIASNGTNCMVVWADNRNFTASGMDIYGVRLDRSGLIADVEGIPISQAPGNQTTPTVASNGKEYFVVWTDTRFYSSTNTSDIFCARINENGKLLDTNGLAITTAPFEQSNPSVAAKNDRYLVVWQDARSSTTNLARWDINGARVSLDGTVLDPDSILICGATNNQTMPAIAASSNYWFVVWEDLRSGKNQDIYGARVTDAGDVLDSEGISICTALQNQTMPSIVSNGENFLVAWTDARNTASSLDIYAARVQSDGLVLDLSGIPVRQAVNQQLAPTVTVHGGEYFIAWQEAASGVSNNFNLGGISINAEGIVISNSYISLNSNAHDQTAPVTVNIGSSLMLASQGFQWGGPRTILHRVVLDPYIHKARRNSAGNFIFTLSGGTGDRYSIEMSTNLIDWHPIATVTNDSGTTEYTETKTTITGQRFYRAVLLP